MLAYIPSPSWSYIEIGPVKLHAYALCILTGVAIATWLTMKRWQARGGNSQVILDLAILGLPAGIIGGRIYHVFTHYEYYFGPSANPSEAFKVWHGGLAIWGAIPAAAVAIYFGSKHYKVDPIAVFDAAAPGLLIAQGIGRWGNWFNQELYGIPTTLPWGLKLNPNSPAFPAGVSPDVLHHPTFLYESLWNIAAAFVLLWLDKKYRMPGGTLFCAYIIAYSIGRVLIEPIRTDPAEHIFGLRVNQVTSIIMALVAASILFYLQKRQKQIKKNTQEV
ncbi:MAG: prolipoprotein diacylglyceryl transferase [Micrococcaceae bacterium]